MTTGAPVAHEADVADEAPVEDRVDCLPIVVAALAQPLDARARRWRAGLARRGQLPPQLFEKPRPQVRGKLMVNMPSGATLLVEQDGALVEHVVHVRVDLPVVGLEPDLEVRDLVGRLELPRRGRRHSANCPGRSTGSGRRGGRPGSRAGTCTRARPRLSPPARRAGDPRRACRPVRLPRSSAGRVPAR